MLETFRRPGWVRWALLAPATLFLLLAFAQPVARMIARSAFDPTFTLAHYRFLLEAPVYSVVFLRTLRIALEVSALCLLLGYPVAFVLTRVSPGMRNVLILLVLFPLWTSILVRTFAWMALLGRNGVVNKMLLALGLVEAPLRLIHNHTGVLIGMVHVLLPFMILPLFSVMVRIPGDLLEAAAGLGASGFQVFRRVFLPLSLPGVHAGTLLVFISGLGFFVTPALLGGRTETMIAMAIETYVVQFVNWGAAAAMAFALLAITVGIVLAFNRFVGFERIWSQT